MSVDQKMRFEQWDIMVEEVTSFRPAGFDPDYPWQWALRASTFGLQTFMADWWRTHITDPMAR